MEGNKNTLCSLERSRASDCYPTPEIGYVPYKAMLKGAVCLLKMLTCSKGEEHGNILFRGSRILMRI
jgi:hypothetical protein